MSEGQWASANFAGDEHDFPAVPDTAVPERSDG